ncbi:hypothetical protein NSQ59_13830 [Margalitia sp. FSL K6-0131]|uniref:hypothetical protein n=1 Tax=Margalitia sp. FSL K6-0131 TaxID=2954604 RepID=UPI0030F9E467
MKRFKWLAFGLCIVILLSLYLYQNYIYYKIPFNPIKEYASESLVDFHITKNLPNGEPVNGKCHESKTLGLVLEYFSNLKLIPLKDNDKLTLSPNKGNGTYLTGMLEFKQSTKIFISDIYIDNPTVLYIGSTTDGFKGKGYYKIVDSKFDYDYIFDLIGDNETVEQQ